MRHTADLSTGPSHALRPRAAGRSPVRLPGAPPQGAGAVPSAQREEPPERSDIEEWRGTAGAERSSAFSRDCDSAHRTASPCASQRGSMNEYVIIGTSHEIQDTSCADDPVSKAVVGHSVVLIAEEYPFKCRSRVSSLAEDMRIPYLQIDPFPEDWTALGIDREMRARQKLPKGEDIRLSNADSVRENFWLEKIEASMDCGRVLVICGYLHVNFLAQTVEERGGALLERSTFPAELLDRKPTIILSPVELDEYLRKQDELRFSP